MATTYDSPVPKPLWVLAGILGLLLLVCWYQERATEKPKELCTYFDRLRPGMTYSEVMRLIPAAMTDGHKYSCKEFSVGTLIVRSNAVPAYEVSCSGPLEPLMGIEGGHLYFDAQDRLIGAKYGSSGVGPGIWKPRWGVLYE